MVYVGSGMVWENLTRRLPILNPTNARKICLKSAIIPGSNLLSWIGMLPHDHAMSQWPKKISLPARGVFASWHIVDYIYQYVIPNNQWEWLCISYFVIFPPGIFNFGNLANARLVAGFMRACQCSAVHVVWAIGWEGYFSILEHIKNTVDPHSKVSICLVICLH